jgi:hypothetical protein
MNLKHNLLIFGNILVLLLLMQRKVVPSTKLAISAQGSSVHVLLQELQHIF